MHIQRTARQLSLIESIEHGEVGYSTYLGGFYFNKLFLFQLADEDQAFLNALYRSGEIEHDKTNEFEREVVLREGQRSIHAG